MAPRLRHRQDVVGVGLMHDAEHGEVAQRFGFADLLLDADLLGIFGRRDLVRHVDDGRDAAADRCGRAGREVLLVRHAGIAEMDVGVDQAGQDVQAGGVDRLLAVRQRVVGADRDDLAVGNGNAALERGLGRDDRAVLHDQICFHDSPPCSSWRSLVTAR